MARRRGTTTKPGRLLRHQIPIRTHQWDEARPGFLEADTVAHCGTSLMGGFDCEHGSEFLNWHLVRHFHARRQPVQVTRSRAYHKDDNAQLEQKH